MANYSKSVHSYKDVHLAFEEAGNSEGIILTFPTPAQAVVWASRANAYRVLLRKQNAAAKREFACEFDHLMVRRKQGECIVKIEPRGFDFVATSLDGTPLEFSKQTLEGPVLTPHQKTTSATDIDSFLDDYKADGRKKK